MPKIARELTAAAVAKLREPGRYPVGGVQGLHLRITPAGTRLWIYRAMAAGKRLDVGLGNMEDMSLSQARDAAIERRRMIRAGADPRPAPRVAVQTAGAPSHQFKVAAEEYIESKREGWKNAKHAAQWAATLEAYAYPLLGEMNVADIEPSHVLEVLKPIWTEKTETATRVRGRIEAVLDYATAVKKWRVGDNPARWKGGLEMILPEPKKVRKVSHHEAMPIDDTPAFYRSLQAANGIGALALQLLILTAARSGEARGARWSEFDLGKRVWTVPAARMKADVEHSIPLSEQALHLLSRIPRLDGQDFLFPSVKEDAETISDMTITKVLRDRKLTCVPHGFRSTFRDWVGEHTSYPRDLAEMALAHTIENKSEAAYRRMRALERRRPLMQDWADFLAPA
ncbi:integrase [Pseudacidovorax sp. 1753]|uniref:tyrosine-type recombinase/integrase n=1 Tax=Pseudacidovorax sp. 1753 TaxID=3156419 RepID=UPI003396FEA3